MIGSIFPACQRFRGNSGTETAIERQTLKWIAGTCAAAAMLWCVYRLWFAAGAFDWRLFLATSGKLRWEWVVVSLAPAAGTYYGRVLRWAVFLKPLKPRPSFRNLLSATVVGFTALALFGRAGEFVRPYLIAIKERVPVASQMAAWLLERLFDVLMALLFFAYALTRVAGRGAHAGPALTWVLAVGGKVAGAASMAALLALVSMRHLAEPVKRRLLLGLRFLPGKQYARAEHLITTFVQGVESTRSDAALVLLLLYSVLEWALIAAVYWCLAQSCSGLIRLSLPDVLVLVGFVSFGATVQIPGVGGGVQVVAVLVLTELFGARLETATFFALVIWMMTFVVVVPVGVAVALKEGLSWRGLRQIGRGELK
ncbi:MAG TPA: lysylphosphatidylglycerol synthase transmembrane domain-containing protein [Bryobacteraceae bacterium]|nr:lysylphosphatidylglycerol synthase transmembrane domain-containing protein [Bryobacteraceae bacterium]